MTEQKLSMNADYLLQLLSECDFLKVFLGQTVNLKLPALTTINFKGLNFCALGSSGTFVGLYLHGIV